MKPFQVPLTVIFILLLFLYSFNISVIIISVFRFSLTLINYSLWMKIQFGCSISIGLLSCRK